MLSPVGQYAVKAKRRRWRRRNSRPIPNHGCPHILLFNVFTNCGATASGRSSGLRLGLRMLAKRVVTGIAVPIYGFLALGARS